MLLMENKSGYFFLLFLFLGLNIQRIQINIKYSTEKKNGDN